MVVYVRAWCGDQGKKVVPFDLHRHPWCGKHAVQVASGVSLSILVHPGASCCVLAQVGRAIRGLVEADTAQLAFDE